MVCVDSSIFITIYRQPKSPLAARLTQLVNDRHAALCGQVWVELLGGFRNEHTRRAVREGFAEYPWLETTRQAFELAAEWVAEFRGLGAGDAIIAATSRLNNCPLFTVDRSFESLRAAGLKLLASD